MVQQPRRRVSKRRTRRDVALVKAPRSSGEASRFWQCTVDLGGVTLGLRLDLERVVAWLDEWSVGASALRPPRRALRAGRKTRRAERGS